MSAKQSLLRVSSSSSRNVLILALIASFSGCEKSQFPPNQSEREMSWNDQVLAVARHESDEIVIDESEVKNHQLTDVAHLKSLRILKLHKGVISDDGLQTLASLPELEQLVLRECAITDAGAEILATFPALKILNLPQSQIGPQGLTELSKIRNLELLRFGTREPLHSNALRSLSNAKRLRFLHFIGVPLTDDSLDPLAEIDTLESLYVDGAEFSDQAISDLLEKRPGLHLHLDQKHHDSDPKSTDHRH
jgi:hypothetical protein